MKFFISFLSFSFLFGLSLHAQWAISAYAGAAPGQNINAQAVSLANMYEGSDFALMPTKQSATYALGLTARNTLGSGFFFQAELMYNTAQTSYLLDEISENIEFNLESDFDIREHRVTVPVSMGAELGKFSFHTGVDVNAIIAKDDALSNLPGIEDTSGSLYLGWHAGLQYNIGSVGLEVRYIQDFRNHASGLTYGEKDITFYGNRNRVVILANYHF